MGILIREADAADSATIAGLVQELAASTGDTSPVSAGYAIEYLRHPGSGVLLAETEGEVVGMVSYTVHPNLYHAGNACLIEELVVRQRARGRGTGHTLLTALLQIVSGQGCVEMSVSTRPDNGGAIKLYHSLGFTDESLLLEQHHLPE